MRTGVYFAVAAAATGVARAELSWGKGGDMCAGIDAGCDSMESCTLTAFGPCENEEDGATQYLSSEFVGLAYVVESDYLTNTDSITVVPPQESTDDNPNGYRDFEKDVAAGDSSYAYTMTGARFGDMNTIGGYVGIVSYLNQGDSAIEVNEASVRYGDAADTARRTDQGTGDLGAPKGPSQVCISEVGDDGACGANRVFAPGEYKFSIFGLTSGTNYPPAKGEGGFPEYTHLGVRMKLSTNGFTAEALMINGDKTLENIGSTDVTSMTLAIEGGGNLQIDFPQFYNVGEQTEEGPVSSATKTIKIRISAASTTAIYIDYLFDAGAGEGLDTAGKYFIYDPDVQVKAAGGAATTDDDAAFDDDSAATRFASTAAAALAAFALLA